MIGTGSRQLEGAVDRARPAPTFADYAAMAICPALIVAAVESLVFFLIELGYGGSYTGRLRWTLFWFVVAMVLVSRIAIEKGRQHAGIYGLGLAAATAVVLLQYVGNHLVAWCLLGLIWWATSKLTWDCTVIDDEVDASGEGLLQAAKLDEQSTKAALEPEDDQREVRTSAGASPRSKGAGVVATSASNVPRTKSRREQAGAGAKGGRVGPDGASPRKGPVAQPHAPGRWVLYFSLGALPVFGIGQRLIPLSDPAARLYAFLLLLLYVVAALGLLLLTSFLGLRRYLRQRHLQMPPAMSGSWVGLGAGIGLAVVLLCLFLPRPNADWPLLAGIDRLVGPGPANRRVAESSAEESGAKPSGQASAKRAQGEDTASAEASGSAPGQSSRSTASEQDGSPRASGPKQEGTGSKGVSGGQRVSSPQLRRVSRHLVTFVTYAALLVLAVVLLTKYRRDLMLELRDLWRALRDFWYGLFGRRAPATAGARSNPEGPVTAPERPFSAFRDPFAAGDATEMSVQELIVHTFRALEAWARGLECERHAEQTPLEFGEALAVQAPELGPEAQEAARLYACVAYGHSPSLPPCESVLQILWSKMTLNFRGFGQAAAKQGTR